MDKATYRKGRHFKLLLAGTEGKNLASLRDLLTRATDGNLQLNCAYSCEEVRAQWEEGAYDMLLGDCEHSDLGLPAETGTLPAIFLGNQIEEPAMQRTLQSAACNFAHRSDPSGPCMAMAILRAVENYQKEKQRRQSEEMLSKLQRAVEQSSDLAMITDAAGVLEYVNPAFEALTGYSREEVVGQTLGILKSQQQDGELYEEMWDTVVSGRVFHGIVVNKKKNGEDFVLEKVITPLRNAEGEITHFISTGRDITAQRKLESDLQQAQKMDAIGRLAGGVAHDFNNLLMVISAYAELMLDSLAEEDPLRQKASEIMAASRRAADLTRQLLAFGRRQMQVLQVLNLNTVIRGISRMLPRLIGEDIQLLFVPGKALDKVKADPVQIEQIIMNLAANARDAMPGGGKLTIETANARLDETYRQRHSMVPPGNYVVLTVTDSGTGISQEHLAHIFEPSYTMKGEGKGTGLGLATVYGIVKQNGGFIWVYSETGLGTTFKIYLPQVQSVEQEVSVTTTIQELPHGCETLLLVEDEAPVRQCTREFLTRSGYTVLEAANGEEALGVSREYCGPIDLLISDVVMPKISGPILAKRLSAERPRMKVLFVSGYAEKTVLQHGKVDVTAHFLQKPFCLKELARKVREVLGPSETLARAATSPA
jgi:PAS domain S-box-containing protein